MVLCIDFRFPDESKQIEVTDESNDQLTLLKCDGTLFVYNQREAETTFDIANLHGVQVLDARKHSSGKRHMIIMLKDEDGYGEFLCEAFSAPPPNITPHAIPQNIITRVYCASKDKMVEVTVIVEKTKTLIEFQDQFYTYPWHDKKPDFHATNIISVLTPAPDAIQITMKDDKDPNHFYECDCKLYDGVYPTTTKEEAIHSKINRKRDQLDDLTRETAEIFAKRPRITPRIRRYQDLIGMIQPLYEEVETEDAGIIQNCIDEINAKYEAEFDAYTSAKNESDAALYRVKQIEAKITDELGILTAASY
jgi:hypothetical protein